MTAAEFAARIPRARQHEGYWVGCCPAHDDRHESLSWKDGDKALVAKCHAGCSWEKIQAAAHVTGNGTGPTPAPPLQRILATYPYHDASGALLYEVVRYEPKTFRQRRPDSRNGWTWTLGDLPRVVYRLPSLTRSRRVYWTEGEKDADRLVSLGFLATTSPGGAAAFKVEYAAQLATAEVREVVVIPDQDAPGQAYAHAVASALTARGLTVRILFLPGLPSKGDVSDWLTLGGTAADIERLADEAQIVGAERLEVRKVAESYYATLGEGRLEFSMFVESRGDLNAYVNATNLRTQETYWCKLNLAAGRSRSDLAKILDEQCPGPPWRRLVDDGASETARLYMAGPPSTELVGPAPSLERREWWLPGWIPTQACTLLFGKTESGKTTTALALCLASLRGAPLGGLRGWPVSPMRSVLYLDWEDNEGEVWRQLEALARAERVEIPPGFHYLRMTRPLYQSASMVTKEIHAHAPEGIVLDSWVPACGNEPDNADATQRIMTTIRALGVTALGIAHVTNAAAEGEAPARPFGSVMNTNLARSTIEASGVASGTTLRVTYRHAKSRWAHQDSRALCFTFSDGEIAAEVDAPDTTKLPLQAQIVAALKDGPARSGQDIADEIGSEASSVTRTLRRGEGRTFIRTEAGYFGRSRKVLWSLNEKAGQP